MIISILDVSHIYIMKDASSNFRKIGPLTENDSELK